MGEAFCAASTLKSTYVGTYSAKIKHRRENPLPQHNQRNKHTGKVDRVDNGQRPRGARSQRGKRLQDT